MIPQEPEERNFEKSEVNGELLPETEQDLTKALAKMKQKAEDYLNSWKRTQADFINYKRYTEQERLETGKYANTQLILTILPILDDFERAFESVTPRLAKAGWIDGIRLIERKLRTTLEVQGLSPIKALGEMFDPNLHEAVMHSKGEDGKVVQEIQKGYKLFEKVIRPSRVAVGNGEPVNEREKDKL
jgi:molecular chaperone GrpE